jgi:hypothetical protein
VNVVGSCIVGKPEQKPTFQIVELKVVFPSVVFSFLVVPKSTFAIIVGNFIQQYTQLE